MYIYNKILKEALDIMDFNSWDNSEQVFKDDIENSLRSMFVYKIDNQKSIRIFYTHPDDTWQTYSEYKNKVYINGKHVQLDGNGYTVNEYKPGEYRAYIEDFDKLEEIEDFTFYECTDLMSIIIPNSMTTIGDGAFWGCRGLTSVIIPNSVTLIDNSAFQDCTGLTLIDIPNKVRKICSSAFSGCTGLTSVTIPNSVTSIGDSAFSDCTGLTSITIPNSVTEMGSCVFYNCTNLKTIYVENINTFKKIKFGGYGDKVKLLRNVELVKLKKDLNEALDLMDFDSWDDSEQTFKDSLSKQLMSEEFIYQMPEYVENSKNFKAFKVFSMICDETSKYVHNVFINGKSVEIDEDGFTVDFKVSEDISTLYKVIIKDIHKIVDGNNFFWHTVWLKSVPCFDTSRCENMTEMFEYCYNLENVPKLDTSNLREYPTCMFDGCDKLNNKTIEIWNPDVKGTPHNNIPEYIIG